MWEWCEDRSFHKIFGDERFNQLDRALKKAYFWKNPYKISREYCEAIGERDVHQYGETPLTTMGKIARGLHLTKKDHLYEYGCGRGRTVFFVRHFFGSRVTGIDRNPIFIERAQKIALDYHADVTFQEEDFLQVNPSDATAIYLYGTCLDDRIIYELCEKFPGGVKIATVSYALRDYDRRFHVKEKLQVDFPWGKTEAYINESSNDTSGMRGI